VDRLVNAAGSSGETFAAVAPVRLDLAGGWTDVPPFSEREGGVVVAATIRLFARAEVQLGGRGFRLLSEDLHDQLEVSDSAGLVRDGRLDLLKAGLRMLPVGACTLTTRSEAPPGSGLGSSGALDVALVAALSSARGESPDPVAIAETACRLEAVEAGIPGGRQDQFASSHGGFLRLDFHDPDAEVERLKLDPAFAADLARRMILCYTSASHFSGTTISRVMRAYEEGDHRVIAALRGLRSIAESMVTALAASDFAEVGRLLSQNWSHQQALDPNMRTADMARLEHAVLAAGALGGKAAGSGAGGCMFFLAPEDPSGVIDAAAACGVRLLPIRWAMRGVYQC
jgi:D-glycero-alpha-D-manno-heptose-7-phosphate kinase